MRRNNHCRVCAFALGEPVYSSSAPSISSLTTLIDVPTRVFACSSCGHCQSEDLPDVQKFYDTEYRISLESDEHDQLYAMVDGKAVFRTDRQVDLLLDLLDIQPNARILDYGAAKAVTLRKVLQRRPDLDGYVFDVSRDYVATWQPWLKDGQYATYTLPDAWSSSFDVVTAHFVLEHVAAPIELLRSIRSVLGNDGKLFLTVPDLEANPGDMLVVDHLNHFSTSSLECAFRNAGFGDVEFNRRDFAGGIICIARASASGQAVSGKTSDVDTAHKIASFWSGVAAILDRASSTRTDVPSAIYGAGVYGSFVAAKIAKATKLRCFVDRNPYLQGKSLLGLPVMHPADLPRDIEVVYAGLNPLKARAVLTDVPEWKERSIETIFLDTDRR
jgi:SAM-dependent methyltransferase